MAATTGITPVEEENPTPMMDKKDSRKKAEAVMAATTQVPLVMPLADERMAQMVEDAPKKFEAMKMAGEEEEEEVPKKVVAGGQEKKDIGLNGKGEAFWSQEVKNDEAEGDKEVDESEKVEDAKGGVEGESSGATEELALQDTEATVFVVEPTQTPPLESNDAEDTGGAAEVVDHENKVDGDNIIEDVTNVIDVDNDKVEGDEGWDASRELEVLGQDDKSRTLDVGEVMKDDDNREPVVQDIEVAIPMVEPEPVVEYNSKISELGEEKCELWKEQEEKVVATVEEKVADKMIDDVKAAMIEEEKSEPEGEKGEEAGYGGGNGSELGEQKEVEVSAISVEAPKLGDEVAPFAKASGELGYEKEGSGDMLIMGGEEALEESTTKDVDVEDEITKLEFVSEFVHGGSIKEVYTASTHCVHANSHGKEKNAKGQINASEVVEEVGADKPLEVENVAVVVEDTSLEKPTEIENVAIEVEVIDIEKPMEVENVIASSDDSILSQELALESSKENNNVEETEGATSVVDHKEEIDHDNIIDAMTNVIDAKNDEAEGFGGEDEGGEVEEVVEGAKGESSGAAEEPTLQDIEATIFVVEPTPTPPLEFNDVEDTEGASGVVDHENMVDDDDIIKDMTNVIDAHNDNVEGDEEGDDDGLLDVVEEDAKARNLDVGEAMKDDGSREPVVQDVKVVVPIVEPVPPVEYKLKRSDLGEDAAAMAPLNTPEGEDKGELWKEREEKVVATVEAKAADKMAGDVKAALTEEEKREPDGEKDEEAGYGGGDGGELGEGKEIEVSTISIDTIKLCDEVSPFTEASGEVGYEKEGSGDIRIMGGEQALEESTNKDVDVEDEFVKPKLASEVVHGGCIEEVYPASAHSVLKSSHGKDKNVEGQTNASEVVKDVGVEKPLKVDNIGSAVKYINFEKPSQIENVATEVEGIDDENPMEVKNIVASTVDGILSLELAPESSKENNNVEETKGATKVVIHEEKVDDDGIIDAMTNVIDAKNNEAEGDRGGDVMLKEHSKGGSLGAVEAMKDGVGTEPVEQDAEVVVSMVETIPEQTLEPKWGNSEIGENGDVMASPDAPEGGDKGELKKELEEEVDVMVEVKVIDDAKTTVAEEEKELESEKGKQLDYEGGDGYGGKSNTVVVHDGSIDEVDSASRDSVLEDSPEENQNVEGQANASKAMEYIGVVEHIDVEKPMEVENVVMYSDDGIISQDLGKDDATMASLDVLEGEEKGEFWEEQKEEEVGASAEVKIVYKVGDDVKVALVDQDKLKPEGAKGDEVDYGGGDSGKLEEEKEAKVSVEADDPEDEVTLLSKDEGELDYNKESNNDKVVVGGEEASEESIGKGDAIEDEVTKPKPVSEASVEVNPQSNFVDNNIGSIGNANNSISTPIQIVYDGSIVEVDLASADSVFEDSPDKEQNTEGISTASGAMEDGGVKKPLGDENIVLVVEDIGVKKHIELQNIVVPVEGIDVEKPVKVQNVVVSSTDVILFQELAPELSIENNEVVEMEGATEVVDYEDEVNNDIRIKAMTDDENGAGDEADDGANSNTSGSSYTNNIFSSEDDSRILIMDQPAGLGSSASSMWPTSPHETTQSKILNTSEIALIDAHTEKMNEEDKKVTDKVELIKVKFLRLVYRLGATVEETVATQVMYRLSLAEGIIHGWQMNKDFNFDNAQKKALILEAEGKHDLNFSCNILVLGKTGVGKSATINSIFGEEKLKTDAFNSATTSVREIVGDVHGVKIRIIDTPGLLPNMMDQASNRKIIVAVKKYTRKCPPDIVLYVDHLDCLSRDLNDLPLLKTITDILGSSIWFNTIVALTHAASPPEGLNGTPLPYEVLMAQSSHVIQQSIRQATRDMHLMNPVALIENHPSCRQNIDSQKVLPNDQSWRHQMLLLCYSAKILSEANSLLKLQDPNPENLSGFHFRSQPFYFLLSSLLQSRVHPKLSIEQGGNEGVSVPLPDIVLPPSFDCDNPTYQYRFLETSSTVLARPILDAHGWDHDCGYDGISMEDTLVILNRFPGNLEAQVTKNKKEFNIHLDSSIAAKYGDNASSLAGFDIQTVGQQLAYILHGETKIKNIKKNKTTGGFSVTFLGDIVATGLKVEDQVSLGKRLSLVACTGAVQAQGDTAYGANLEARLKDKDYPIGQSLSTLGLCLMKWHEDLALGANLQSQFSTGRGSKMALRLGLNNKLSGKITVKTSTSEHVQIALLGLVPVAASIYRSFRPSEP